LTAGCDLVTFSGDKLLGATQAGLILGRRRLVERLRKDPLARALRVDKLTLAALEATLAGPPPPVVAFLNAPVDQLRRRASVLSGTLRDGGVDAEAVASVSMIGGGAAPGVSLPSAAVSVPAALAAVLRAGRPPVVGRIENDRCLLDLRTVAPPDDAILASVVLSTMDRR